MNFTNSGSTGTEDKANEMPKGMKRRNFLGVLGLSAVGVFLLSKLPGKLFSPGINKAVSRGTSSGKPSITVKENPNAVKRISSRTSVNTKNNG